MRSKLLLVVLAVSVLSIQAFAGNSQEAMDRNAWIMRFEKVDGQKIALVRFMDTETMSLKETFAVIKYKKPKKDDEVSLCKRRGAPSWAPYTACRLIKRSRAR